MKVLITLYLVLGVLAQDKYDENSHLINISEVLSNVRILKAYAKCLLDQGRCTTEFKKIKDYLPEVLTTTCAKCTDKQKHMGKQLVQAWKNKQVLWKELVAKYDPKGEYQIAFKDWFEPLRR